MHHSDVVANEAHKLLKAVLPVSFASRVPPRSAQHTFPNLSCISFFHPAKRPIVNIRTYSRTIPWQRDVWAIFRSDFNIKVSLSSFTAVVHPIVVSALLCILFLHMTRHKDVAIDRECIYTGCRIAIKYFLATQIFKKNCHIVVSSISTEYFNIQLYILHSIYLHMYFTIFYKLNIYLKIMFCYICICARIWIAYHKLFNFVWCMFIGSSEKKNKMLNSKF